MTAEQEFYADHGENKPKPTKISKRNCFNGFSWREKNDFWAFYLMMISIFY